MRLKPSYVRGGLICVFMLVCLAAFQNFTFAPGVTVGIYPNTSSLSRTDKIALVSLQGLANRTNKQLYLRNATRGGTDQTDWIAEAIYKDKAAFSTSATTYTSVSATIAAYKTSASVTGVVIWDTTRPFTLNIATNLAGVQNLLIFSDNMRATAASHNLPVVHDLVPMFKASASEPENIYQANKWVYDNYYSQQSTQALGNFHYDVSYDAVRDYAIQNKIHVFWLPAPLGKNCHNPTAADPDYSANLQTHIEQVLFKSSPNIPILGFWETTSNGQQYGYCEFHGVKFAGEYGKFTVDVGYSANFSFHSRQTSISALQQQAVRTKPFRTYNPNKKYVALIMQESGDSPAYWQFAANWFQWSDGARGQVPVSYGVSPQLYKMMPALVEHLYASATANDFFYNSITGLGYSYPLQGYGLKGTNVNGVITSQTQIVSNYFQSTSTAMNLMNLDMLGFYTGATTPWEESWRTYINTQVVPRMPGLVAVVADMSRSEGMTAANSASILDNGSTALFHTLTRWKTFPTGQTDPWLLSSPNPGAYDTAASQWLANEIQTNSNGGKFIQAMALSWHYGPTRLKMAQDQLTPQGYEFVTLNEFNDLYRQYLATLPPPIVTSSGVFNNDTANFAAVKAFDVNKLTTRWASNNNSTPTWIKIDLESQKLIKAVNIRWETAGTYRIEISNDNTNWTSVASGTAASNSMTTSNFSAVVGHRARYVRVSPNAPTDPQYRSIYDISFTYGTANDVTLSSSGVWNNNAGFTESMARDNSPTTYWASNYDGSPVWYKMDLGISKVIKTITIKWATTNSYKIEVSNDNSTWTSVGTGNNTAGATTATNLGSGAGVWGRYIRVSTGTTTEFQFLGLYDIALTYGGSSLVTSSGVWNNHASFTESMAIDNTPSTYWASNYDGSPVFYKMDIGSVKIIKTVSVHWATTNTYRLEISSDNINWTSVHVGPNTAGATTVNSLNSGAGLSARYIRLKTGSVNEYQFLGIFEIALGY